MTNFGCFVRQFCALCATALLFGNVVHARGLRVGLYGGTFDPPTPGHEFVIDTAIAKLNLDILYVLPNVRTEHKPNATPFNVRSDMAQLAFGSRRQVRVSPDFLIEPYRDQGLAAAVMTFLKRHRGDETYLVMGDDSFKRNIEAQNLSLGTNVHLVIFERELADKVYPAAFNQMPIIRMPRAPENYSSTQYRALIARGIKPHDMSPRVWNRFMAFSSSIRQSFCELNLSAEPVPLGP